MTLLERQAEHLGYQYVYLWTNTAVPFYHKLGYQECERVSLHRECLKGLESQQVSQLENLLMKKTTAPTTNGTPNRSMVPQSETILLPPPSMGGNTQEKDVWLRKRLIEAVSSIRITDAERLTEIREKLRELHTDSSSIDHFINCQWLYRLVPVPWQQQVGPSCGLAALRMLYEHYHFCPGHNHAADSIPCPSLLKHTQERGYTNDGEVFDANNLLETAQSACQLSCEMRSCRGTSVLDMLELLLQGGTAILPYDSTPITRKPGKMSGHNAHYGIIVGLVLGCETEHETANDADVDLEEYQPLAHSGKEKRANAILLLVQHSLSRDVVMESMGDLWASNAQLVGNGDDLRRRFPHAHRFDLSDRLLFVYGPEKRGEQPVSV